MTLLQRLGSRVVLAVLMLSSLSVESFAAPLRCPGGSRDRTGSYSPADKKSLSELDKIKARFKDETMKSILSAQFWTLAHCASDDEKTKAIAAIGMSKKGVRFSVRWAIWRAGGTEKYRKRVSTLLESKDETVRGFAAVWLGVLGDQRSIPDLLKLLRSTKLPVQVSSFDGGDRARAAMALGLLDAKEHAPELGRLLIATNANVRGGAALGLGYMEATKYAPEIAKLLADESDRVRIDAVIALAEMGAKKQARGIASLLKQRNGGDPDVKRSALYALARLNATEHAQDIALLLEDKFEKGDAAKALALMKACEYKEAIVKMLDDEKPLHRCDALLALGMLRAIDQEDKIARHLDDPEEFVRPYAAWAIIMIESRKHAPKALRMIPDGPPSAVLSVGGQGAVQIAAPQFRQVADRTRESFRKIRALKDGKQ